MSQERNKNQEQGFDPHKGTGDFGKGSQHTGRTPGGFDDKTKIPEDKKY